MAIKTETERSTSRNVYYVQWEIILHVCIWFLCNLFSLITPAEADVALTTGNGDAAVAASPAPIPVG